MHLIDGKVLAAKIRGETKEQISRLGLKPKLGIVLVGNDPASELYVALKNKAADEVGVIVETRRFPAEATDGEIIATIDEWNRDADTHGILVQLPLPPNHDENRIIDAVDPVKDADGFHPRGQAVPPIHRGVLRLVNETPLKLNGATAAIVANSEIFSAPLQRLLALAGMLVTVMKSDDLNLRRLFAADLVVTAVGKAKFLISALVKDSAVIIDVGTNKTADGKVCGDADRQSFEATDCWLSPVPGGVGPMTIAELLQRVTDLATPPTLQANHF
jgi:methylenetetrahydrofolate dehydrogenase (NADP+)/methenyltetrahydrofolate cyclohydrolase